MQRLIAALIMSTAFGAERAVGEQVASRQTTDTERLRRILIEHSELVDPFSAQFRKVTRTRYSWCGELNAKNSMGGYAGWRRFWISDVGDSSALVVIEDKEMPVYREIASSNCPQFAREDSIVARIQDSLARAADKEYDLLIRTWNGRCVDPGLSDEQAQMRSCLAMTKGGDENMRDCLMKCYRWTRDAATFYWQKMK